MLEVEDFAAIGSPFLSMAPKKRIAGKMAAKMVASKSSGKRISKKRGQADEGAGAPVKQEKAAELSPIMDKSKISQLLTSLKYQATAKKGK